MVSLYYVRYSQLTISKLLAGDSYYSRSSVFADIGSGPIFVYDSHCTGMENSILECDLKNTYFEGFFCDHFYDVTLECIG